MSPLHHSLANPLAVSIIIAGTSVAALSTAKEPLVVKQAIVTAAQQASVPASSEGPLQKIHIREGQQVQMGELLASVDSREAILNIRRADQAVRKAKHALANDLAVELAEIQLALADAQLQRLTTKVSKVGGVVSEAEIDRARLTRDESRIRLEQAKQELKSRAIDVAASELAWEAAKLAHEQTQIVSSLNGEIVRVLKHTGEWVRRGDPVAELMTLERMRVEWLLPADIAFDGRLEGSAIQLRMVLQGEPQLFQGRITYVHNDVSNLKGKVRVWAEVDNRDLMLRPGMKGEVIIEGAP